VNYFDVLDEIEEHIVRAQKQHGDFASTHEALGVALEEWNELCDAVHSNVPWAVRDECIDLAAVLIRLAGRLAKPVGRRNAE
jgi:hypothetical protein